MTTPRRLGPARRSAVGLALAATTATLAANLAACSDTLPPTSTPSSSSGSTTSPSDSSLDIPSHPLVLLQAGESKGKPTFTQEGSADVTVKTAHLDGGQVQVLASASDPVTGPAILFPPFVSDPKADYPRAVVVVHNAGAKDQFDPGTGRFELGIDFDLDAVSTGRENDNGNNMIQRGLSSDKALYKLEVDADQRPTCTMRGTRGTVILRSTVRIVPGVWWRVRCTRDGDELAIEVGRVLDDGGALPITQTESGAIGDITMKEASIPISIGGKVAHNGSIITSASDQFNGQLRSPFVDAGG